MPTTLDRRAVLIVSGGMDSCVLAHYYASAGWNLHLISFNYGQKHVKELSYAERYVANLRERYSQGSYAVSIAFDILELPMGGLLTASDCALLNNNIMIPHGHYTDESMKVTVVPYRNPNMLLQAATVAWNEHAHIIAFAAHHGDHAQYPDCRQVFVDAFNTMLATAMIGQDIKVETPFMSFSKAQIARLGASLHVPFELTWSCYEGGHQGYGDHHCGLCGTCWERRESFLLAGVPDPTLYAHETPFATQNTKK